MPMVVDLADAAYELLLGEAEIWPGPRAWKRERAGHPHPGSCDAWVERLQASDAWCVRFAREMVIWQRGAPCAMPSVLSRASQ
jgi:hypothetical protein